MLLEGEVYTSLCCVAVTLPNLPQWAAAYAFLCWASLFMSLCLWLRLASSWQTYTDLAPNFALLTTALHTKSLVWLFKNFMHHLKDKGLYEFKPSTLIFRTMMSVIMMVMLIIIMMRLCTSVMMVTWRNLLKQLVFIWLCKDFFPLKERIPNESLGLCQEPE